MDDYLNFWIYDGDGLKDFGFGGFHNGGSGCGDGFYNNYGHGSGSGWGRYSNYLEESIRISNNG
jgi:hypothetical protein